MSSMSTHNEDGLDNLFHLGQYVICRVIESQLINDNEKINQQKRLRLSINPKDVCDQITPDKLVKGMILPGVVSSIADHGFIINIGFSQRKGFLPKNKYLNIGNLTFLKPRPALSPTKLPFHMLLPGLKCKVTVDKTRVNGLEVSFGEVKGFIHAQNFPTLKTSIDDFSPEQELEATILSIDPTTKLIHYSIQPHFLSLNSPPSILDNTIIGSIQTCTVIRNIGSLLVIRIPSLNQYEIVSSSQLTDEKYDDIQQILNSFKSGQKIQYDIQSYLIFIIHFILFRCRIIGISLASNLAICSLKQSIIEAPFITYSDIQIGSSVKGSITHVDENGLIINLTKYINGFVPIIHNADIPIKETLNKFPLK
ncbi:unnamed protein product [Rotaria sp. Silwood1]|nr:unnamed protein product [Rotaria sp. Silwood1]